MTWVLVIGSSYDKATNEMAMTVSCREDCKTADYAEGRCHFSDKLNAESDCLELHTFTVPISMVAVC